MRIIFLGAGAFGLPTLEALAREHEVVAVVTQPDRPAGRKRQLTATPIGQWAAHAAIDGTCDCGALVKFENANEPAHIAQLAQLNADAAVVIAFGQKLSPDLIDALGGLTVNLHASLLPRWRGAAPINWAMIHGDTQTGVSVISLAQRMDAGLVYATKATAIDPNETVAELHDRLAELGPEVILKVLAQHAANTLVGQAQDEALATRAPKLSKADGRVDWSLSASQIRGRIHGLTPWPGVRVKWHRQGNDQATDLLLRRVAADDDVDTSGNLPGDVMDGHCVACGQGAIRLIQVQVAGKPIMPIEVFANGYPFKAGDRLSAD